MAKLRYVDTRPMYYPKGALEFYPGGLILPGKENEIQVTDDEKRMLMKRKNGKLVCFEEIRERKQREEDKAAE